MRGGRLRKPCGPLGLENHPIVANRGVGGPNASTFTDRSPRELWSAHGDGSTFEIGSLSAPTTSPHCPLRCATGGGAAVAPRTGEPTATNVCPGFVRHRRPLGA